MNIERILATFLWAVTLFLTLSYSALEADASPVAALFGACVYGIMCAISPRWSESFAVSRMGSRGTDKALAGLLFMGALMFGLEGWIVLIPFTLSGFILTVSIRAELERARGAHHRASD